MTYETWERDLRERIESLPEEECDRVLEYYREMFGEMTGGGRTEESVLEEFGTPEKCAAQVLGEWESKSEKAEDPAPAPKREKRISAAEVVGLIFFTLFLVLPFVAVAISIVISFAAVTLAGGVTGIAGIVFALYYPFSGALSSSIMAGVGLGIASSGVGLLLFVAFWQLTKRTAMLFAKAFRAMYVRR